MQLYIKKILNISLNRLNVFYASLYRNIVNSKDLNISRVKTFVLYRER